MPRPPRQIPSVDLISTELLKQVEACRPTRIYIKKHKKKNPDANAMHMRVDYLRLSSEKQEKYLQKSVNKFIELLDENDVSEERQVQSQIFDYLLTKPERRKFFESLNAPVRPPHQANVYYAQIHKQDPDSSMIIPWKLLDTEEKKRYSEMLVDANNNYQVQVQNFADTLPDRLKSEYLQYSKLSSNVRHISRVKDTNGNVTDGYNDDDKDEILTSPIRKRRKSVSFPIEYESISIGEQKLTRVQREYLLQSTPSMLYFEKKFSGDEKPSFTNALEKRNYIRTIFNALSEKKKEKYARKAIEKWYEFLEMFPSIVEKQIPTLNSLLARNHHMITRYFERLGMPQRAPTNATQLFNLDRAQTNNKQNWMDLSDEVKRQYSERLMKLKSDYHNALMEFVEKILPSDYIRMEFFRNIKQEANDYEWIVKKRRESNGELLELKSFHYLIRKKTMEENLIEFNRIKKRLLSTQLTGEQKYLVEQLTNLVEQFTQRRTPAKKTSSIMKKTNDRRISTDQEEKSKPDFSQEYPMPLTTNTTASLVNGGISSENDEHQNITVSNKDKKHKKRKREGDETTTTAIDESSSSSKKSKKKTTMSDD